MKRTLLLLAVVALCGCNSVSYSRLEPGGAAVKFSARGLFMNVATQQLAVDAQTGTNRHGLSVKGVNAAGDSATIQAIIDGAIQGAVKAAAATAKP